jgi:gamma-glutamyltranspeptidase/glutathione hydrolase
LRAWTLRQWASDRSDHIHAFVESKKHAFADRARYYADPAFYQCSRWRNLLSKEYAAAHKREQIDMQRAAREIARILRS